MYIEWTQEHKDKVGNKYLTNGGITNEEDLQGVDIQELAFLITSAHYFHENKAFINDNLMEKSKTFDKCILEKIKELDEIYILYSKVTGYPFIVIDGEYVLTYSDEVYANDAIEDCKKQGIELESRVYRKKDGINIFAELYRMGIENIFIDRSSKSYNYAFRRSMILPPPDWSNTPKISIPICNPELVTLMILYYEALYMPILKNNNEYLRNITDFMNAKMLRARYLIPVKIDGDMEPVAGDNNKKIFKSDAYLNFPALQDNEGISWMPIFTDWEEFKKLYDVDKWKGQIISLEDVLHISKETGIVINGSGTPIKIDTENKSLLKAGLERINEIDKLISDGKVELISDNCYIGDVSENDKNILADIKGCLKKISSIKKAYIKLKIQNDIMSYLLLVDFKGNKQDVFPAIAKEVMPYLENMYIDIREYDEWAEKSVKDSKPLYKKFSIW